MMKKLLLTFGFLLMGVGVFAQAEQSELRGELIEYAEKTTAPTIETALSQLKNQIPDRNVAAFEDEVDALLGSMYEDMADLYLESYSQEDLKKMMAFYNSPTGQRIMEKMPDLLQKSMSLGQQMGMKLQPIYQKYAGQ